MTQNNEFSGCDNASNGRNTIFDWDDFFINRYWFNFFFNRNSRKYENIYLVFGNYKKFVKSNEFSYTLFRSIINDRTIMKSTYSLQKYGIMMHLVYDVWLAFFGISL